MARPLNLTRGLAMSGLALFAALVVLFLFLPLAVVVIISFSADSYLNFPPSGWAMRWYTGLEDDGAWLSPASASGMPEELPSNTEASRPLWSSCCTLGEGIVTDRGVMAPIAVDRGRIFVNGLRLQAAGLHRPPSRASAVLRWAPG